jgi:hypothetical protein
MLVIPRAVRVYVATAQLDITRHSS